MANIKIKYLDIATANKIIELCPNASFNINFVKVDIEKSLNGLKDGQINTSFSELAINEAAKLIKVLRQ
jgi:hypothetical protein